MAMVYTFPQLTLPSGTFDITIKAFLDGNGTHVFTDKYFSSIEPLVKETEVYGGSLRHDSIRFTIEFDKDNWFRDNIFSVFSDPEGWVDILIKSSGEYQFYGTIDPTTISYERVFVESETHESVTFDAHWVVRRLERVTVAELEALFLIADCFVAKDSNLTAYAYLFRLTYVFEKMFELLKTETGLTTVNVSFLFSTPYKAISKDALDSDTDDVLPLSDNTHPTGTTIGDRFDNISFNDFLLLWKYTDTTKTNTLWDTSEEKSSSSFYNKDNVYEVLVDMLKSFGFILTIEYISLTELSLVLKDRVDGVVKSPSQLLSSEKSLLTTEYLEKITTTAKDNNSDIPPYEFSIKTNFGSSFDYQTAFKTEYFVNNGDTVYKNHLFTVQSNVGLMLRDILEGNRLNSNWDFVDQLGGTPTGYTSAVTGGATLNCVDHTIDNHTPNTTASGSVEIAFPALPSTAYLQVDVGGSVDYEMTLICWVKIPSWSLLNASSVLNFTVTAYDDTPTLLTLDTSLAELNNTLTRGIFVSNGFSSWRMMSFRIRPKKNDFIRYIRFTVQGVLLDVPITVRLDDFSINRSHQYFHQLLGRKLQRYYARPNSKLINKYNGIVRANCGDSIVDNNENFYIKKISQDYQENETEIEAINY